MTEYDSADKARKAVAEARKDYLYVNVTVIEGRDITNEVTAKEE